ncbi:MAG TPA: hypothetical protein VKC15_11490, partial [Gemmatimonadales bacterium]|nr:hypothetical protein [Gemmatimonadales bacterium]
MTSSTDDLDRREALKLIASGLGIAALGDAAAGVHTVHAASSEPQPLFAAPPMETVRIGFVGVG